MPHFGKAERLFFQRQMEFVNPEDLKPKDLDEWKAKLLGKTLVEGDVQVTEQTFHVNELPKHNRVLGPRTPATRDYRISRLNVCTDESGVVTSVYYG